MSLTNPPAIITQLSAQVLACASIGAATTWYPTAPAGTAAPYALVDEQTRRRAIYASDAPGLPSGALTLTLIDSAANRTIGQLEDYARTILAQLTNQVDGIAFRDGEVGLCQDYQPATEAVAGTAALRSITISLAYGLDA